MGSLPGMAELRRMESDGRFLLPEEPSPSGLLGSPSQPPPSQSDPISIVGVDLDSIDDTTRTVDFSDFSSSSSSESDSESGVPPPPPFSSADQPEIVSDSDRYKPLRLDNDRDQLPRPRRRMIPISDPSIRPNLELPLLGREKCRRVGGLLLSGVSENPPEWLWWTSVKRVLNPPLMATAGGLILGLSPLGATPGHLYSSSHLYSIIVAFMVSIWGSREARLQFHQTSITQNVVTLRVGDPPRVSP